MNAALRCILSLILSLFHRIPEDRYRYNRETGRCEMFRGCLGSGNNFPTLAACQRVCEGIYILFHPMFKYMYMYEHVEAVEME